MVPESVEQSGSQLLVAKNLYPLSEGEIGRYHRGADFVALGDKVEEQLPSGPLERDETQLVQDQHIHPPQTMVQQG